MTAYYNENDRFAAAWLRELMGAGLIAPGVVDERSIEDVRPGDLRGFTQCHFFAGIGVWSYALRLAGWPDDRRVWTGSCPCQPFSTAGQGGGFADERHLWPAWFQLVAQCRPDVVFGEQVASRDGLAWFDLVCADLEAAGYACGGVDLCAAGVGAPHVRQRLFWAGDAGGPRAGGNPGASTPTQTGAVVRPVGHASVAPGPAGQLGDADDTRPQGRRFGRDGADECFAGAAGVANRLAHNDPAGRGEQRGAGVFDEQRPALRDDVDGRGEAYWSACDWVPCRDGAYRPVEPGAFPLAHGAPARVGRLRGYGNAIVAPLAATFIEAYMNA